MYKAHNTNLTNAHDVALEDGDDVEEVKNLPTERCANHCEIFYTV